MAVGSCGDGPPRRAKRGGGIGVRVVRVVLEPAERAVAGRAGGRLISGGRGSTPQLVTNMIDGRLRCRKTTRRKLLIELGAKSRVKTPAPTHRPHVRAERYPPPAFLSRCIAKSGTYHGASLSQFLRGVGAQRHPRRSRPTMASEPSAPAPPATWGAAIAQKPNAQQAEELELFMSQISSPRSWYRGERVSPWQMLSTPRALPVATPRATHSPPTMALERTWTGTANETGLHTTSITGSKTWGAPGVQSHRWWSPDEQDCDLEMTGILRGAAGSARPFHR